MFNPNQSVARGGGVTMPIERRVVDHYYYAKYNIFVSNHERSSRCLFSSLGSNHITISTFFPTTSLNE